MSITESFTSQLDDLLARICEKLQINETQHKLAKDRYDAVSKWLSRKESPFASVSVDIYPQGSLRIGTTVRPLRYQEYDLDLVCELGLDWNNNCPIEVLNTVEKCLKENEMYKPMVERKNRCIRLNYANEFHMDILPAAPNYHKNGGCVMVPDRKSEEWKDSNPTGYAGWFKLKSESFLQSMTERLAATVQPLPAHEPLERKTPLQRAVQLIKRYRDVTYLKNPENAPISIVLTTLAGNHYKGQISVTDSISSILDCISKSIPPKGHRLVVYNPTNRDEDLSEKWDEEQALYFEFVRWIEEFKGSWGDLRNISGIPNVRRMLVRMFGEDMVDLAIREQVEYISKAREGKSLGILPASGILTTSSTTNIIGVKKNTFYGE